MIILLLAFVFFITVFVLAVFAAMKLSSVKHIQYVNWVGACDEDTCAGCRKAFEGNPYPIDKAPRPGSFECGDKCRHALQLVTSLKKKDR